MVWPDQKPDWQLVYNTSDKIVEAYVIKLFERLDHLKFDPDGNSILLEFTEDAQPLFDQWQTILENRLRSKAAPVHLEAHFAKYKKLVPALCLILEHLKTESPTFISAETIKEALEWAAYLESHAMRVYSSGVNVVPKIANDLLRHIREGQLNEPFSARDVYHGKHWSGLTNTEEVEEVLEYLVDKGWLASAIIKTNGRSSKKYWVHPKVYEG
jgi:hypothetical protein